MTTVSDDPFVIPRSYKVFVGMTNRDKPVSNVVLFLFLTKSYFGQVQYNNLV